MGACLGGWESHIAALISPSRKCASGRLMAAPATRPFTFFRKLSVVDLSRRAVSVRSSFERPPKFSESIGREALRCESTPAQRSPIESINAVIGSPTMDKE